ncbi:hypothetical protein C922_05716 [Plasmodium inui San Antonio 1]|uniref:Uncharacterized protein n=1 Tax=Plasmodium inui San Antonio 1 TaxID=1237626 RepID=W6ZX79_9APIC|nr:hypothetical protein C922_05716 [Plasmodium inui San Antonio 1]EUD63903.1 hypothetical protein C922_05716 [Plasmodium inui San Antonio 1]
MINIPVLPPRGSHKKDNLGEVPDQSNDGSPQEQGAAGSSRQFRGRRKTQSNNRQYRSKLSPSNQYERAPSDRRAEA